MKIPFNILDFLDRAELVYGDRIGIVDEPDQPADSWGELTWRQVAEHARALAAGLDALGVGRGERVAIVSQNSARLLVALFGVSGYGRVVVPINFRLNAEEVRYIVEHSGASVLLVDPELDEALADVDAKHRFVLGPESDEVLLRFDRQPEPVARRRRGRCRVDQLHERHDGPPEGRRADPPQPVRERHDVRLAHRRERPRRLPLGGADVPLQRLGHGLRHHRAWAAATSSLRKVDGPEILRRVDRHGVTFMGGAPAVVNTILAAAADDGDARPRRRPHRRRRRTAADGHDRACRDRARLGVHADLRPHRDVAAAHAQPPPGGVGRPHARPSGRSTSAAPAPPALGVHLRVDDDGEVLARGNVVFAGYWRQPEATAEALADGWFHTGDGGRIDDDGYVTISDRKKDVIITGGENVSSIEVEDVPLPAPRRRRGRRHRRPRREVGRDGQGDRRAPARRRRHRAPSSSRTAGRASPTTSARPRSTSRARSSRPRPARSRSSSSGRRTGTDATAS